MMKHVRTISRRGVAFAQDPTLGEKLTVIGGIFTILAPLVQQKEQPPQFPGGGGSGGGDDEDS